MRTRELLALSEEGFGPCSLSEERVRELQETAKRWACRLANCAGQVWIYSCPKHGAKKTVCSCCQAPCCPRRERRYSQAWVRRAVRLQERLERYGVGLNPDAEPVPVPGDLQWRFIEMGPRERGDVFQAIDDVVKLRADLARLLRDEYGMIAGLGSLEREGAAHLNFVALTRRVPRAALQHWLRSRDCTIRHCHHPADDRCEDCKRAKTACSHPERMTDGTLRPRCNGSWYVHVEQVYERGEDGRRIKSGKTLAGALREAVKYAGKPTPQGISPHRFETDEQWRDAFKHNQNAMLFYLGLRGRHRVETYGLLKQRAPDEDDATDDVEIPKDGGAPRCPDCHAPMQCVRFGSREFTMYAWSRPADTPGRGS